MKKILGLLLACLLCSYCSNPENRTEDQGTAQPVVNKIEETSGLSDYWYQGEAEINRYTLEQNRYKDVHPGEAVLVFVTEDFLTDKQVKNDNYTNPNSVPILKNNILKKFPTGIYDYSIMSSVFTPVETKKQPHTLKVTTSSQEWCGHTFMQINKDGKHYKTKLHSYFENEGDQERRVPIAMLEDEIFNRIRMNPKTLPTGKMQILPGTVYTRLRHFEFKPVEASASLGNYEGSDFEGDQLNVYQLRYPALNRTLEIIFEAEAPYEIIGWIDAYPSAFDRQVRKTIARRTHSIMSAYWTKNGLNDMALREQLGL